MDELKRCPFCGGEASLDEIPPTPFSDEYSTYYSVGCKECNIGWYEESRDKAIAAWNRREYSERHNPKALTVYEKMCADKVYAASILSVVMNNADYEADDYDPVAMALLDQAIDNPQEEL